MHITVDSTSNAYTAAPRSSGSCRFCGAPLRQTFVDLGLSPLCETYPGPDQLNQGETFYPLHVYVCGTCFLVQLDEYESPEAIFREYAYFSSYSDSWLKHARLYCDQMIARERLTRDSLVVEVASNDGYLLQYFVDREIPVLGVEPARNVAKVALEKGVPTLCEFFGSRLANEMAQQGKRADLIAANNVLAQVPDLNDFVEGLKILLKPSGVLTLEFPHLLRLIEKNEFDTIYHEHFSYFSLFTTKHVLEAHGLTLFDVEELPTHGGSLRVHARRPDDTTHPIAPIVPAILQEERRTGLDTLGGYDAFGEQVKKTKWALLEFLLAAKREGKAVAGYGAPGKSATLLHYCGIGRDLLAYTVDRSPYKQGRFLPGNHIPIYHPDRIHETKPDYVLILPWNLKDEISAQLGYIRAWGGRFVVPIPTLKIF